MKNGTNGAPGSVVTIDEEGYWCIDGKRQTDKDGKPYKAQGEKGDTGADGQPGDPGADGKDGCWYFPDKDGFWHKQYYNEKGEIVDEATDVAWTPSAEESVRVVYDPVNGCLQISNAVDMEKDQVIYIPITSNLKSLAVIPYAWDREMGMPVVSFYNIMGYETSVEPGSAVANQVLASSTKAKAHFRLNPANANVNEWDWSLINRTVEVRAAGDNQDLLSIASYKHDKDELIFTLKSNKSLSELRGNERAIVALQGVNKESNETLVSDYVKVTSQDLAKFSIIDVALLETGDPEGGVAHPNNYKYAQVIQDLNNHEDVEMVYTESVNLNEYVATWAEEINTQVNIIPTLDNILDEGELTYEFKAPETYLGNDGTTNQQDFIVVNNGIVTVNKQKYPNGEAAIGRTPIIEVMAKVNDKLVAYAYIRLSIVKEEQVEQKPLVVYVSEEPIQIEYSSIEANKVVQGFTWERMNREVYDVLKLSHDEFINTYIKDEKATITVDYEDLDGNKVSGVTINREENENASTNTNVLGLTFDETLVSSSVTGTATITYTPANTITNRPVQIVFKYVVSHKHESFPEFNSDYVNAEDVAIVRGKAENGKWVLSTEIREHFIDILSYEQENNHSFPYLVIRDNGVRFNVELTGENLKNQKATLSSLIAGDHLDVAVDIMEKLANNEEVCVKTYTIRFVNPFKVVPTAITLDTPIGGASDEEIVTFKILENKENGVTLGTWKVGKDSDNNDVYTFVAENAAKQYLLTEDQISVDYRIKPNNEAWVAEFGTNIINNDAKLKLEDRNGIKYIVWNNGGTSLLEDKTTSYTIDVKVEGVSQMRVDGSVKINKTVQ